MIDIGLKVQAIGWKAKRSEVLSEDRRIILKWLLEKPGEIVRTGSCGSG
jgi:hypothetical protein